SFEGPFRGDGNASHDTEAAGLCGAGVERSAEQLRALAHAEQPASAGILLVLRRRLPGSVVEHRELEEAIDLAKRERDARGTGMPEHVGERLLRDAIERELNRRGRLGRESVPNVDVCALCGHGCRES